MKQYLFILLFLAICSAANAATGMCTDTNRVVADTDSIVRKRLISLGITYGSDIQFFGRTGPVKYPYLSADAIYNFKSGFFIYGSAVQVFGYTPVIDEIDAGAGYLFKYTKNFTGTFSYTHFFFTDQAPPVIVSASSNDINFKNSYDFGVLKAAGTFDYLFGDANDYFLTLSISKYIEPGWRLFGDQDYLSINPGASVIMGTQNFVGRYASEHSSELFYNNYIPAWTRRRLLATLTTASSMCSIIVSNCQ